MCTYAYALAADFCFFSFVFAVSSWSSAGAPGDDVAASSGVGRSDADSASSVLLDLFLRAPRFDSTSASASGSGLRLCPCLLAARGWSAGASEAFKRSARREEDDFIIDTGTDRATASAPVDVDADPGSATTPTPTLGSRRGAGGGSRFSRGPILGDGCTCGSRPLSSRRKLIVSGSPRISITSGLNVGPEGRAFQPLMHNEMGGGRQRRELCM